MNDHLVLELRTIVANLVKDLDEHPVARRLFDGTIDKAAYTSYLIQAYHYVKWSACFLCASGGRTMQDDPTLGGVFLQKTREEHRHESLVLNDLSCLGVDPKDVADRAPCAAVAEYIDYHRVACVESPGIFLGSAYVLESLAAVRGPQALRGMESSRATPEIRRATSFIRLHAKADPGHVEEMEETLQKISDRSQAAAILGSAAFTAQAYRRIFDSQS